MEPTGTQVPDAPSTPDSPTPESIEDDGVETESIQSSEALPTDSDLSHPWDQPIPGPEYEQDEPPEETSVPLQAKSKRALLPLLVAGAGVSAIIFLSSLYVLSRPCVVGRCKAMTQAQELSQKSAKTLQNPQSGREILEAQQELKEAIEILESIPWWSRYHSQAQDLLKADQAQSKTVDEMVTALKTAARASYKSENPPHPPSKWIEIQGFWREAIAQLEQLPTQSNLQPLAQQKIKEYQVNLAETNQRLAKERQAQEYLKVAQEAALIAEARQGVAQSLDHWQLVYSTWQMVFKRIKQIPQGTMAYEEAQQLSAASLPKMASARDRTTQEKIAANAYNEGLRIARLAQDSQVNSQWSTAVNQWRNALTFINQVPQGTFYYGKAQLLVNPYKNALKQAQGQLQFAMKLQQARKDLNQTCYGKTRVCNYTIENNLIKVRLTPAYVQTVKQTDLNAKAKGDSNTQVGVVNHILTLEEALEAISDNAKIRVEVYAPEGSLIQVYTPGT